jgi:hypothetical protein
MVPRGWPMVLLGLLGTPVKSIAIDDLMDVVPVSAVTVVFETSLV